MRALLLVDCGNTRTKIGVAGEPVRVILRESAFDPAAWSRKMESAIGPNRWVVAGVNPKRVAEVVDFAASRGEACWVVRDSRDVPLEIIDCDPTQIGVDRLLDALAASRRKRTSVPAITVDAGTAIVVNLVRADGAFLGGGIMPGLTTMFGALPAATAKLPRVVVGDFGLPPWPGTTTVGAITAGCFHALTGGITGMVSRAARLLTANPDDDFDLFLTGGDADRLAPHLDWPLGGRVSVVETLTLEGLMHAAGDS